MNQYKNLTHARHDIYQAKQLALREKSAIKRLDELKLIDKCFCSIMRDYNENFIYREVMMSRRYLLGKYRSNNISLKEMNSKF